jgi:hypothetical protein
MLVFLKKKFCRYFKYFYRIKNTVRGESKKITILILKISIGLISFWLIYSKLAGIPHLKEQCAFWLSSPSMYVILAISLLLMPLNWGIESYKWQTITRQVQSTSYLTALKSVFSGICFGNIAPGRAIEFLAKIFYFKPENRPQITVLHFINGMFQMLITVTVGVIAIIYKLNTINSSHNFIYLIIAGGFFLILLFGWAILNVTFIQSKLQFIKWFNKMDLSSHQPFTKALIIKLISLSVLRYLVFTTQFYLVYNAMAVQTNFIEIFMSIAAYFMLTSLIPMISYIEPAIRAAIALFVFNTTSDSTITIVLSSTFVWIINVVIPSIIGYIFILQEKIDFKTARAN